MRIICNNRKCIHRLDGGDENNCANIIITIDSHSRCLEVCETKK